MGKIVTSKNKPLEFISPEVKKTVDSVVDTKTVPTTEALLKERGSQYGDFTTHARLTQALKSIFYQHMAQHNPEGFRTLQQEPVIREGIEMIFHKLGRVGNGNPKLIDNFDDIAGYSKLVADYLRF